MNRQMVPGTTQNKLFLSAKTSEFTYLLTDISASVAYITHTA